MILRAMVLYFLLWIFRRKNAPVLNPLSDDDAVIPDSSLESDNFLNDKEL